MGYFEIDTDGKPISFMISDGLYLYMGAKGDEGTIESIHRIEQDKYTKDFKLTGGEIWHRRAKFPLFERVALQFIEIVNSNFLGLDEKDKNLLIGNLFEIALDLSKAEESLVDYVESESKAISDIQNSKGVKPQDHAFVYKNPTVQLQEIAEQILIRVVIAYRKLPKIISIIRKVEYKPGKTFLNQISELLPRNHPDRESLAYDNKWIKELYDIRGDIEHQKWSFISFEVRQSPAETGYEIQPCSISVKSQDGKVVCLSEYLSVTLYNMVTFIEEIISLAMVDKIRAPIRLVNLPENERPKRNHFRFVLDLVPEIKAKLPKG